MRFSKTLFTVLLVLVVAAPAAAGDPPGKGDDKLPFPAYGTGPVEVRIYSDYFCPPCQKLEPSLEVVLKDLLKRQAIRLVMVDLPLHQESPLYARYFLYALKSKRDIDHALWVRGILYTTAEAKDHLTAAKLEELFKKHKIPYTAFDPKPVFQRYNALLTEDRVNQTPTAVIVRGGKKETLVGVENILNVLKEMK